MFEIVVFHENLIPLGGSYYDSRCPFCVKGKFSTIRNEQTKQIEEFDVCTVCGQKISYADIKTVRERDPFKREVNER